MKKKRILILLISIAYAGLMHAQMKISGSTEVYSNDYSTYSFQDSVKVSTSYTVSVTNGKVDGPSIINLFEGESSVIISVRWNKVDDGETVQGTVTVTNSTTKAQTSLTVKIKGNTSTEPTDPDDEESILPKRKHGYYIGDTIKYRGGYFAEVDEFEWEFNENMFRKLEENNKELIIVAEKDGEFMLKSTKKTKDKKDIYNHSYAGHVHKHPKFTQLDKFYASYNNGIFKFYNFKLETFNPFDPRPQKQELITNEQISDQWSGWIKDAIYAITFTDNIQFKFNVRNVWLGKPKVMNADNKYEIDYRSNIELPNQIDGVANIRWECISGAENYKIVEEKERSLIIKPTLKFNESGTIIFKCIAENECGSVLTLHTLNIREADGDSFGSPIDLGVVDVLQGYAELSTRSVRSEIECYDIGDTDVKMYYSFIIESDIASIFPLSFIEDEKITTDSKTKIYIYDENFNFVAEFETDKTTDVLDEMGNDKGSILLPQGKYYMVCIPIKKSGSLYASVNYYLQGGLNRYRPFNIKTDPKGFSFTDVRDLSPNRHGNYLTNNGFSHLSNEFYYKFTLSEPMDIRVHPLGSGIGGVNIWLGIYEDSNDGYYPTVLEHRMFYDFYTVENFISATPPLEVRGLPAGEYYLIVEGYKASNLGSYNGLTSLTLEGFPVGTMPAKPIAQPNSDPGMATTYTLSKDSKLKLTGDTSEDGFYSIFSYEDKDNNRYITPSSGKELYHKIVTAEPLDLIIHHAGSKLTNTYIHILKDVDYFYLKKSSPLISVRGGANFVENVPSGLGINQAHLELKNLEAGTYYIVSEGYLDKDGMDINGEIIVNIEAKAPTK